MTSFALFGFGRAARSLCATMRLRSAPATIIAYARRPNSLQREFAKQHDVRLFEREEEFLENAQSEKTQVLFISVSDDAIRSIGSRLKSAKWLPDVVAHLSGALSCDELGDIADKTSIAQFHPLVSLDGVSCLPPQCLIAVNCDHERHRKTLLDLANEWACLGVVLKAQDQALYHAAAALTGNLSLGLVSMSQKLFELCGFEKRMAQVALAKLLKSAAHALEAHELSDALTGPLARGDVQTVAKHLESLRQGHVPGEILSVYSLLSAELLDAKNRP